MPLLALSHCSLISISSLSTVRNKKFYLGTAAGESKHLLQMWICNIRSKVHHTCQSLNVHVLVALTECCLYDIKHSAGAVGAGTLSHDLHPGASRYKQQTPILHHPQKPLHPPLDKMYEPDHHDS